ncbi:hypothetical protein D1631_04065 [Chryseobacterium nematophagum]|uniref:Uncharacterized protein n=1 Tax=Chryseobacterium nematophagum TaxID=2305228 RepID=A0A3M7TE62_9FLAO|nr:hypothetical protein [Chryseobacterium nematophagum]RNA61167.1 hypothetical protein D1631_04065 [Chryseobacterium nematophagum]
MKNEFKKTILYSLSFLSMVFITYVLAISLNENNQEFDKFAMLMILLGILPVILFIIINLFVVKNVDTTFLKTLYGLVLLAWVIYPVLMDVIWYFNRNDYVSSSSTRAIHFIIMPYSSIFFGLIPSIILSIKSLDNITGNLYKI